MYRICWIICCFLVCFEHSSLSAVTYGINRVNNASFIVYSFQKDVNQMQITFPIATLENPFLQVQVRNMFNYQLGYASNTNHSYIQLPLTHPIITTIDNIIVAQDPSSNSFYNKLWGIAIDGIPIYSSLTENGVDIFEYDNLKVDSCGGVFGPTAANGENVIYHYRSIPSCILSNNLVSSRRQTYVEDAYELLDSFAAFNGPQLLGYSLKGVPIYSPYDLRGHLQDNLDNCNGKYVNGSYGYYVTPTFPYVIGCDGPGIMSNDISNDGSSTQVNINEMIYKACPVGYFPYPSRIGHIMNGCKPCPAGKYSTSSYLKPVGISNEDFMASACYSTCPVGSYCPEASVQPLPVL